ncbi:MAG TPA: Na+/H+ antiporter subunit E [Sedimentisphaerales bacterium]|nr:Na+/H+ antiporter subunit E [Sedimentisphaerales bacterium]
MRRVIYFVVAFIVWVIGAWPFVAGETLVQRIDWQVVIAGLIASAVVALLFHEMLPKEHRVFISPVRVFWALVYVPVFFYYVIKANFDVVYRALHPQMPIKPGIVKIKTNLKTESGITALANSITLTPGTLTVDLTDDGFLYVHWINVKSDDVEQATNFIARRFEWFVKKIFE